MPSQSVGRANIMSSALGAIFYVEFDNQYGRTLTFQEPHDAIAAEEFDAISDYLIPKPQLCGQLIALRLPASRIVLCFPMMIEDEKYERNALIFALGFVLADGVEDATCERHGPPLRKACSHLAALEIESQLLSDSSKKGELAHLLPRILHELQDRGECIVAADAANIIRLQLPGVAVRASMAVPPALPSSASASFAVDEHAVPVLVAAPSPGTARGWDLTLQKLLRWITGTRTATEIAAVARTDLPLVLAGLRALHTSGWVRLVDKFAMTNRYACLPALRRLANDTSARAALASAVAKPLVPPAAAPAPPPPPYTAADAPPADDPPGAPSWVEVLRLYAAFQPSGADGFRTVSAVCELLPELARKVDMRALVHVGLLNGLLVRMRAASAPTATGSSAAVVSGPRSAASGGASSSTSAGAGCMLSAPSVAVAAKAVRS